CLFWMMCRRERTATGSPAKRVSSLALQASSKLDSGDGCPDVDPHRRDTDLENDIFPCEIARAQIMERGAKLTERRHDPLDIGLRGPDPHVEVTRGADDPLRRERVSADDEELNALGGECGQQISEVAAHRRPRNSTPGKGASTSKRLRSALPAWNPGRHRRAGGDRPAGRCGSSFRSGLLGQGRSTWAGLYQETRKGRLRAPGRGDWGEAPERTAGCGASPLPTKSQQGGGRLDSPYGGGDAGFVGAGETAECRKQGPLSAGVLAGIHAETRDEPTVTESGTESESQSQSQGQGQSQSQSQSQSQRQGQEQERG